VGVDDSKLRIWILYKLHRHGYWGKGHISADNLTKGQSPGLKKQILNIADAMVKEGLLIRFPHGSETHYYLNKDMRVEIERLIES